jgi:hypothetical protein
MSPTEPRSTRRGLAPADAVWSICLPQQARIRCARTRLPRAAGQSSRRPDGPNHLRALGEFETHYNEHRPHCAAPLPPATPTHSRTRPPATPPTSADMIDSAAFCTNTIVPLEQHGRGFRHPQVSETEKLSGDALIAPVWILPGQTQHGLAKARGDGWRA